MALHRWWTGFGETVAGADDLVSAQARAFAETLARGSISGATLTALKKDATHDAVAIEIDVERPQDLAYRIEAKEPVAVLFGRDDQQPRVLALRDDFPDTPHQNWTPEGSPCSLCIDDRPWAEAKLTSTPADFARRIQLWLAKAARGELHDPAQPLDPLFFQSALSIVVAPSVLENTEGEPAEIIGYVRRDNPGLILTAHVPAAATPATQESRFLVLPFETAPQSMARLRHAPVTLAGLQAELVDRGIDLVRELKARLTGWAGMSQDGLRRLNSRLVILVIFPIQAGGERSVNDLHAFVTPDTAGEIGVTIGALLKHKTQIGAQEIFSLAIGAGDASRLDDVKIDPADVHFSLYRELAAAISGHEPDRRKAILVGAGSLGSQIGLNLAREGTLSWTVVDQDVLLPHNLARHGLLAPDTGAPKAVALASRMGALLGENFGAARCDVTGITPEIAEDILADFAAAQIIVDASASVAVSRFLADMPGTTGRRLSAFFNPAGNAVVLLAEDTNRNITLRDLEAQYHDLVLSEPSLAGHLHTEGSGVRYSGSCRALTNRIPATKAALLSALVTRGISDCLRDDSSTIRIWTVSDGGEVQLVKRRGAAVTRVQLGSWLVTYDEELMRALQAHRTRHLPSETGGVLLGIIDVSRKSIHVVHAMSQPADSRGSITGFERGVAGLADAVGGITESTLHQLRYVGEWHSHPRGSTVMPSPTDIGQLAWLAAELEAEEIPGLMIITGDDGALSVMLVQGRHDAGQAPDRGAALS